MKKTLVIFLEPMGDEYEPTRFSLEHEERGYNYYFDISISVLRFRPILFEEEWRFIDSIEDVVERRRRESEQLTIVLASLLAQLQLFVITTKIVFKLESNRIIYPWAATFRPLFWWDNFELITCSIRSNQS